MFTCTICLSTETTCLSCVVTRAMLFFTADCCKNNRVGPEFADCEGAIMIIKKAVHGLHSLIL